MPDKKSNIILIGMPGAGKSTIGVVLAKTAGLQFIDTDLLIQQKAGTCLQNIIDTDGIGKFLNIEEETVSRINYSGYVIATGGSVVFSDKAMNHLSDMGTVVYLDVPLEDIKKRLDNIKTRGIAMRPDETIDSVYSQRLPLYKKYADITVSAGNNEFESTVEKIVNLLYSK